MSELFYAVLEWAREDEAGAEGRAAPTAAAGLVPNDGQAGGADNAGAAGGSKALASQAWTGCERPWLPVPWLGSIARRAERLCRVPSLEAGRTYKCKVECVCVIKRVETWSVETETQCGESQLSLIHRDTHIRGGGSQQPSHSDRLSI